MALDKLDFEKLYNQYSVLVYNLALNYLQNIEDAEEITQDVFIQINNSNFTPCYWQIGRGF